jgi:hypothetical protein
LAWWYGNAPMGTRLSWWCPVYRQPVRVPPKNCRWRRAFLRPQPGAWRNRRRCASRSVRLFRPRWNGKPGHGCPDGKAWPDGRAGPRDRSVARRPCTVVVEMWKSLVGIVGRKAFHWAAERMKGEMFHELCKREFSRMHDGNQRAKPPVSQKTHVVEIGDTLNEQVSFFRTIG